MIYVLLLMSMTFACLWSWELYKRMAAHKQDSGARATATPMHVGTIIRLRHAYISELFNSDTLTPDLIYTEAREMARILSECEKILDVVTGKAAEEGKPPNLEPHLGQIETFVAKCGALRDPFFKDATLFYLAGLLEYGGLEDEAGVLRSAMKHGALRAKARQASLMMLRPTFPASVRKQQTAGTPPTELTPH